jgi:hypothetical protein
MQLYMVNWLTHSLLLLLLLPNSNRNRVAPEPFSKPHQLERSGSSQVVADSTRLAPAGRNYREAQAFCFEAAPRMDDEPRGGGKRDRVRRECSVVCVSGPGGLFTNWFCAVVCMCVCGLRFEEWM